MGIRVTDVPPYNISSKPNSQRIAHVCSPGAGAFDL
jgi:hypothetical protein